MYDRGNISLDELPISNKVEGQQEFVLETSEDDDNCHVTAASTASLGLIKRLKRDYPDEVAITHLNIDGSLTALVPKRWMVLRPPKRMSAETIAKASERLRKSRSNSH